MFAARLIIAEVVRGASESKSWAGSLEQCQDSSRQSPQIDCVALGHGADQLRGFRHRSQRAPPTVHGGNRGYANTKSRVVIR
jgi:hypothetical protein